MEQTAVGVEYIDGRIEYVTVLYGVSEWVLREQLRTRDHVLEFIRQGDRDSVETVEELELLPEEYGAAVVVPDIDTFFQLPDYGHFYLCRLDGGWKKQ